MPWRELKPMDLKVMFIADYLSGRLNFSHLREQAPTSELNTRNSE